MYSELQAAIQTYLETELADSSSVILEDQPRTPDEFQRRLNGTGWGVLLGKPVVRKEGPFVKVLTPILADENRETNRAVGGPNQLPDDLMLSVENWLRDYQVSDIWTPLKLSSEVKQLFPDDGKTPWSLVIETKTVPVVLYEATNDTADILVFDDDSEIALSLGPGH